MRSLSDRLDFTSLREFTKDKVLDVDDLFAERAALFFTPTRNLPDFWIGEGRFDITMHASVPSRLEYQHIPGYRSPRFWVDQLQRATGKLRWRPMERVRITYVVYDTFAKGPSLVTKALQDALTIDSTGRRDGRRVHYFGAIPEDGWNEIAGWDIVEEFIANPNEARTRLVVEPSTSTDVGGSHVINHP